MLLRGSIKHMNLYLQSRAFSSVTLALLHEMFLATSGCSSWHGCQPAPHHPPPSGLNKQLWAKIFCVPHFLNGKIRGGDGL